MADDETESEPAVEPSKGWTVFEAVPTEWSDSQVASLERWKQGDLITDLPVTWMMPPGSDEVTTYDNALSEHAPAAGPDLEVAAAILCSQTCDIGATSPGDVHPFVLAAPLVAASQLVSGGQRALARGRKVAWLFPTLAPDGTYHDDQEWYVDLRLMVPVSKAALLSRDPVEGLPDDDQRWSFSEHLAQKFRRPALSAKISDTLPGQLRDFVKNNGKTNSAFLKVEQVRLQVMPRDLLNPPRASLLVFSDSQFTADVQKLWREFDKTATALMRGQGITLSPMVFTSARTLTADVYRATVPIMCDLLGHTRYP